MPQRVMVTGHGTVEFPDGMSQDQIKEALDRNFGQGQQDDQAQQPSMGVGGALANVAAGAAQGIADIPSIFDYRSPLDPTSPGRFDVYGALGMKDMPYTTPQGRAQIVGNILGGGIPLAAPEELAAAGARAADTAAEVGQIPKRAGRALREGKDATANVLARFAQSPLSDEELLRNLEATKGTATGLGEVIGSPTAKRLQENILTKVPFSGANEAMQEAGRDVMSRGEDILDSLKGDVPHEEVSDRLGRALIDTMESHRARKNALYDAVNKRAEEMNFSPRLDRFMPQVQRFGDELENSNVLQFEPESRALINRLRNYRGAVREDRNVGAIVDESGQPFIDEPILKSLSLQEANLLASKLSNLADTYGASVDANQRNASRVLGNLGNALKSDVRNSIYSSKDRDLINKFHGAERNYALNFSDFLDKDIHKFTNGNRPPEEIIANFIKSSAASDKADQLEKLMKVLKPEHQDLVRYGYLSRALGGPEDMKMVNPRKLATLWKKLGYRQRKILFPIHEDRRTLDNFAKLADMNQKAVNMMWNPATGQMNMDAITAIMSLHPIKSIPEVLGARTGSKILTDEKLRERVVKSIIERRRKATKPKGK